MQVHELMMQAEELQQSMRDMQLQHSMVKAVLLDSIKGNGAARLAHCRCLGHNNCWAVLT